ncbi:MAG: hypothetical protein GX676_01405 [Bacilli bacterium]|nr:hypothetical protein [Bacilli bacterium]
MNKNLYRSLVWTVLVVILSFATYYIYKSTITNSIKLQIEQEKAALEEYTGGVGKIDLINLNIARYRRYVIEDNKYSYYIPDGLNLQEILMHYVERPILLSDAELITVADSTDVPKSIDLAGYPDVKAVKLSVNFYVDDLSELYKYIEELQNSVRLIYIGSIRYVLPAPGSTNTKIRVTMEYYLFYRNVAQ